MNTFDLNLASILFHRMRQEIITQQSLSFSYGIVPHWPNDIGAVDTIIIQGFYTAFDTALLSRLGPPPSDTFIVMPHPMAVRIRCSYDGRFMPSREPFLYELVRLKKLTPAGKEILYGRVLCLYCASGICRPSRNTNVQKDAIL